MQIRQEQVLSKLINQSWKETSKDGMMKIRNMDTYEHVGQISYRDFIATKKGKEV